MKVASYDFESYDINSMYPMVFAPYIPKMSLILGEAKIHGARYYTVQPVFGNWQELEDWAVKTYGEPSIIWYDHCGRWYMNNSKIWFRNESDRTLFLLRWQ